MPLHISSSEKVICGTTEILPSHNECGGFWIIWEQCPKKFHSATLPPISDTWRLLKISGEKTFLAPTTFINKQNRCTKLEEMERTRTTEHTNPRSKQRSKEQSSSSQSRPNVRIKIPNIHNSSGNNKRKKKEEERKHPNRSVCADSYPQIPNSQTRERSEGSDF